MEKETASLPRHGNAYNLFILVLTVVSLIIMIAMLMPLHEATIELLLFYNNVICCIFLVDFFLNLFSTPKKSDYFIKQRGWLDLIGSFPSLGISLRHTGILRLARLSRFARISRLMRGKHKKQLVEDIVKNRGQYAAFITILLAIIVLTISSVFVLEFESRSPDANILTGQDAIWYAFVTITTVGYGDYYPVTTGGRVTALFIMITGVGIIGALASILSSILVGSSSASAEEDTLNHTATSIIEEELANVRSELASLRQLTEKIAAGEDQLQSRK
jgi:voltage-gated potassium channel